MIPRRWSISTYERAIYSTSSSSINVLNQGDIRLSVKDNGIGMPGYKVKAIADASPEILQAAWRQMGEYQNTDLIG